MMEFLVISNVILWIAVLALTFVVLALSRQIGVLYERVAPAGALMLNQKLKAGDDFPDVKVKDIHNKPVPIQNLKKDLLFFFVSPDCPVCKSLLPVIKGAAKAEKAWLDLVFVSDGDQWDHQGYIKEQGLADFPYVLSENLGKICGVSKLPFGVLIGKDGKVASLGLVNTREHLESLFISKELGFASIQDYLESSNGEPAQAANG